MGLGQALSNILEEHCSSFLSLILSWFYILIFLSNCILSCARSVSEYSDNKLNFILQNSILFIVKKIKLKKKGIRVKKTKKKKKYTARILARKA
jgi:hypothetical protein